MFFRESKPFYMKICEKKCSLDTLGVAIKRKEGLPVVRTRLFPFALQETFRNCTNFKIQNDREWNEFSTCFGNKNALLLKY